MSRPDNIGASTVGGRNGALLTFGAAVGALVLLVSACGSGSTPSVADAAPSPIAAEEAALPSVQLIAPFAGIDLVEAGAVLIDVRTPAEFDEVRIDGAVLIDIAAPDFDARLDELDRDEPYVVYCRSGNRSAVATARMAQLGFTEVYDMGGIIDWQAAGLPVVTG